MKAYAIFRSKDSYPDQLIELAGNEAERYRWLRQQPNDNSDQREW